MDVLVYSALNEQAALKKEVAEKNQCLIDLKENKGEGTGGGGGVDNSLACAKAWLAADGGNEKAMWLCPGDTTKWTVWEGTGWTGEVKVCDTSSYYRCNASCTWTVPSGTTSMRVQMWGAGGGANKPPCCCGHTPFGSTGAYSSVIVPVQAGWTYTLCAGCAYCCYGFTTTGHRRWRGQCSYIQGCHFCNFCVDGGRGSMGNWMADYGMFCTCKIAYYTGNEGYEFCNQGTDWCSNGQQLTSEIDYVAGAGIHGSLIDMDEPTAENVVYGIRGIWPKVCYDGNHYGYDVHPPTPGFLTGSDAVETTCCVQYTSGTCCGCQCSAWQTSCMRVPGAGGWGSHAMGGSNSLYGDVGKMGMVWICYK